jgi:hypothetical protein
MIKAIVLLVKKRPRTDGHLNYSVRLSGVQPLLIVKLRKNSVNNTAKKFLGKPKEF